MSLFGVLGSGFGLYGYLPALVSCRQRIVLPERYRWPFAARPELAQFAAHVEWVADESAVMQRATGIALALKPSLQSQWLQSCLTLPHLDHLVLEKPLGESPAAAEIAFRSLTNAGKTFRIAYTFRFTPWGKDLLRLPARSNSRGQLSIAWSFSAHHFRQNVHTWKREHSQGGAVIRFYGIHLIALLAERGYRSVVHSVAVSESADEFHRWTAVVSGAGLPDCHVAIDSKSPLNRFQVVHDPGEPGGTGVTTLANLRDPYDQAVPENERGVPDQRIPLLGQLCQSLWEPGQNESAWYAATLQLWRAIEEKTDFRRQMDTIKPS